jgi:hypothetical protein
MFYLIPITILAYKYRLNIGYYLMKSYSYLEIQYYRWYNKYYLNPGYKLFINGEQIYDKGDIHCYSQSEIDGEELVYEIEYIYKNKIYRINGNDLEKILDYLDKIDSNVNNPKKIYRWISATDTHGNCYLELVKKYSGPLGDFYNHTDDIEICYKYTGWLKDKTIKITDFRLDEYILDGTKINNNIKLE